MNHEEVPDELYMKAVLLFVKRREIDIVNDHKMRRIIARVVARKRGLTMESGRQKI